MINSIKSNIKIIALIVFTIVQIGVISQQLAFPTAEGYGAFSKGGRYGKVVEVTNLNDAGDGSFRAAIEDSVPRIVVFRVSGTIELKSDIVIKSPFITIAGQTAPGDGICLKNFPLVIFGTNDVVVRFIRIRPGIESGLPGHEIDGIRIKNSKNVIIDHCTATWSVDEILNTWHGTENITVQWSMFAEPLHKSIHRKGPHGFGASLGGNKATYHHNLFANSMARNPSVAGNHIDKTQMMDFRNNVVFNWGYRSCDGKPSSINFVANYYKPGSATKENVKRRLARIESGDGYGFLTQWYIKGNYVVGYPDISAENSKGGIDSEKNLDLSKHMVKTPFKTVSINEQSAEVAYQEVLAKVGVVIPKRDKAEERIIKELKTGKSTYGNGIIDNVEQVGGWPLLKVGKAPLDSDKDGMPDKWEKKNNLNPTDASDGNLDSDSDGYTNVEEYLNSLIKL